jgi:hypothetical protein
MGASTWEYYVPYATNPLQVLSDVHNAVLADQHYYWPRDDVPRPTSLAQLHELYEDEVNDDLASNGTHSILDVWRVLPAGSPDEYFAVMPLTADQVQTAFGTTTPTRAQFSAAYDDRTGVITDVPRWSGRFTTLYDDDGNLTELVVWGVSGD